MEVGKGWLSLDFAEGMGFNFNNGSRKSVRPLANLT
jgi:hypothetical protein